MKNSEEQEDLLPTPTRAMVAGIEGLIWKLTKVSSHGGTDFTTLNNDVIKAVLILPNKFVIPLPNFEPLDEVVYIDEVAKIKGATNTGFVTHTKEDSVFICWGNKDKDMEYGIEHKITSTAIRKTGATVPRIRLTRALISNSTESLLDLIVLLQKAQLYKKVMQP